MNRQAAVAAVALVLGASPLYAQTVTVFTVTAAKANVHADPSTGSRVVGTTERGTTFEVTRELGSWVRVNWPAMPGGGGYLHVTWGTLAHGTVAAHAQPPATEPPRLAASPAAPAPLPAAQEPVVPATSMSAQLAPQISPAIPPPTPLAVTLPTHALGIGGRMAATTASFLASGRFWPGEALGVQLELGRATSGAAAFGGTLRTTTIGSSLVYSTPDVIGDAVWVRPYVGAGASLYRATFSQASLVAGTDRGVGYQLFGGGEFTWAGLPHLAVSAEIRRDWAPSLFPGSDGDGLDVGLSAHWYVK